MTAATYFEESYPPSLWAPPLPPATGATAGTPGTFTPAGSAVPATGADFAGLTASPTTRWTAGQYVEAANADRGHWNGTAWTAGVAPTPIVATGATAGTPGDFTPQGADVPANRAALATVTASPATLWDAGDYVVTFDLAESYWTSTAWAANRSPGPPPPAVGATAGTPGTFTPAGCVTPANGAAIATLTATPATSWSTGQYVAAANADERYWSGSAWQTGRRPAPAATGATAGTPGTFTPAGAATPATGAVIETLTASPTTAWTTGQYVAAVNADQRHWDGAAWQTGQAVAADPVQTRSAKRKPTA